MKASYAIPVWKQAPFIRLIIPLIAGIVLQWYLQFSVAFIAASIIIFTVSFFAFYTLSFRLRFKLAWLQGVVLNFLIASMALLITWLQDARHQQNWYGHLYAEPSTLIVKINEPLIEKSNSYKADGLVETLFKEGKSYAVNGKILLYFKKTETASLLKYGDKILINAPLQKIKNSGNPGAFNYERYAGFQGLYYSVYLSPADYLPLHQSSVNVFYSSIFSAQKYIIGCLKKYLPGNKNTTGIAEALLIGYKEDLDKDLVQAYSNTGVVHVIAISGLHLGLIYVLLLWIFTRLPYIKNSIFIRVTLILICLWLFAILTGASASVLRSAVMFTCILIGSNFFKQASVYNSLAASAFLLLAYNPYFLWDVGFRLSYFAVYGIVWLQKPIYHLWFIKNKWLQKIWEMMSITIAAQIITFPICIFYFHQFPNLFLVTNLIIVPLSTLVLFAEIFLVAVSWQPFIAALVGKVCYGLLWLMNFIITTFNSFSFSVLDKIYATSLSTWLLYGLVFGCCAWLLYKIKTALLCSMICAIAFVTLQFYATYSKMHQQKIIVYNVPRYQAVDFVYKNKFYFVGDSLMQLDAVLQNFHLKPSRVLFQTDKADTLEALYHKNLYWQLGNKKCIFINSSLKLQPVFKKIKVDMLLISKNPAIKIEDITNAISPSVVVFDASNSLWKIENWKKECEHLLLRFHSTPAQGAFIMDAE
ncbi:MAG: ComEC family competence protein [Bacteroidetes bacterium]|nr:ComEC family competence protein [Bacteroidota bacterium]MBS1756368.1 ComEC family competence protein [Bacteroidota bacterium]